MKTQRFIPYLLPIVALFVMYIIFWLNNHILNFPPPEGPSFSDGLGKNFIIFIGFLPAILLSYLYVFICKRLKSDTIKLFTVFTVMAIIIGELIILYVKIYNEGSLDNFEPLYVILLCNSFSLPMLFLTMQWFVRYHNAKRLELVTYATSLLLLACAVIAAVSEIATDQYFILKRIYSLFIILTYTITYLLSNLRINSASFATGGIISLAAASILEFATPLNYMLVHFAVIASIMFAAKKFMDCCKPHLQIHEDVEVGM